MYQENPGQKSCSACLAGTYNPNIGSTNSSACISCKHPTYLPRETECPSDASKPLDRTKCVIDDTKNIFGNWFKSPNSKNFYCCPSGNNYFSDGCNTSDQLCYIEGFDTSGCLSGRYLPQCIGTPPKNLPTL